MVRFKVVFGPRNISTETWGMKWMFTCILMNDELRGYTLPFSAQTRRFSAKPHASNPSEVTGQRDLHPVPQMQRGEVVEGQRVTDILKGKLKPDIGKAEVVHKDAFLDDGPIQTGRVTDILRKKLRPEHFTACMAASILKGTHP